MPAKLAGLQDKIFPKALRVITKTRTKLGKQLVRVFFFPTSVATWKPWTENQSFWNPAGHASDNCVKEVGRKSHKVGTLKATLPWLKSHHTVQSLLGTPPAATKLEYYYLSEFSLESVKLNSSTYYINNQVFKRVLFSWSDFFPLLSSRSREKVKVKEKAG